MNKVNQWSIWANGYVDYLKSSLSNNWLKLTPLPQYENCVRFGAKISWNLCSNQLIWGINPEILLFLWFKSIIKIITYLLKSLITSTFVLLYFFWTDGPGSSFTKHHKAKRSFRGSHWKFKAWNLVRFGKVRATISQNQLVYPRRKAE